MSYNTGARIVTNGLVMYLDAANSKSIVSGSNVWRDLSGNGNNATLTNGPTFNSLGGGSIVFDGVNDYAVVNDSVSISPASGITITSWTKCSSYGDMSIVGKDNSYQNQTFATNGIENSIYSVGNTWIQPRTNQNVLSTTNWNHITMTYNTSNFIQRIYLNGVELISGAIPYTRTGAAQGNINDSASNLFIGSWAGTLEFFNGNIAAILLHNRALSPSEILQNYNATKKRFGL